MEIEIPDREDAACDMDQLESYFVRRGQYEEAAMANGAARRLRADDDEYRNAEVAAVLRERLSGEAKNLDLLQAEINDLTNRIRELEEDLDSREEYHRRSLAEAQRERDEARAEASKWKHLCSGAVRLKRVRDARLDAIRQALEQNKDDALVRVEARWLVDCAQSEIEFPERQRREELDTAVDRAIREARRGG